MGYQGQRIRRGGFRFLQKKQEAPAAAEHTDSAERTGAQPHSSSAATITVPAAGAIPLSPKKHRKHKKPTGWVIPAAFVYMELLLRLTVGMGLFHKGLPASLLTALCFGCCAALLCGLSPNKKLNFWLSFLFIELGAIWFLIAHFCDNAYKVFMSVSSIVNEAGNVVSDFGSTLVNILVKGFPIILLYHVPTILVLIFRKKLHLYYSGKRKLRMVIRFAVLALLLGLTGYFASVTPKGFREKYTSDYNYNTAVRSFGLLNTLQLDLRYLAFGNPHEGQFLLDDSEDISVPVYTPPAPPQQETPAESGSTDAPEEEAPPPEEVYNPYNVMDVDYEALLANFYDYTVESMHKYVVSQTPSLKNDYTGIFKDKNLILITAEALCKEIISPELTPALYRLSTSGIVFEDFYQPSWGGSTSTGEYSFLVGLVPYYSTSMEQSFTNNLYFTMGNQLQRLGYTSHAYHNGNYYYYSRNDTHPNLGYSEYVAMGRGMNAGVTNVWPASDLEMFEFTFPQYRDEEHFSVYYMSVSGHCAYNFTENAMSKKNREAVQDLPYSDTVKAYFAASLELEYALEYLLDELDRSGMAENTVIALCPDHYPYGLEKSMTWNNYEDYLKELYGYEKKDNLYEAHNVSFIWCGSLEHSDPIVISDPTFSLDLLPTLSNLFGLEYDSRMLVGRDVFSDQTPLVFWLDRSWKTEVGYYDANKQRFTVNDGFDPDADYKEYIESVSKAVTNKFVFSRNVLNYDYFYLLFGADTVK